VKRRFEAATWTPMTKTASLARPVMPSYRGLQTALLRIYDFFSTSSSFARVYILFFCLIVLLMISSGQMQLLWRLCRISADPVATTGHVTRLDCSNHGHVDYAFEADGASRGGENRFVDGINCPDIRIGQPIAVYYERGTPANNYALYPNDTSGNRASSALMTALTFTGSFLLLGPAFLGWLWTVVTRWTPKPR
jgi:hypothetical protein